MGSFFPDLIGSFGMPKNRPRVNKPVNKQIAGENPEEKQTKPAAEQKVLPRPEPEQKAPASVEELAEKMLVRMTNPPAELVPPEAADPVLNKQEKEKEAATTGGAQTVAQPPLAGKEDKPVATAETAPKAEESKKEGESLLDSIFEQDTEEKETAITRLIRSLPDISVQELCDDLAKVKAIMQDIQKSQPVKKTDTAKQAKRPCVARIDFAIQR
ncbi:MAG: hypothetical protein Q8O16_04015 [Dehalococcoidia bacterium]|nr:hypothetical protein [Dehalococcoidia bacterium]